MGRWLSPDWSPIPAAVPYAKLENPQTLNLYAYVGNNPLGRVDKDGHDDYTYDQSGKQTGYVKRGFWHNFFQGNSYTLNADNGKSYSMEAALKPLSGGQRYTLVGAQQTLGMLNSFEQAHAAQPGQAQPSTSELVAHSQTGGDWDFKQTLNKEFGAHTLFVMGEGAYRSDFLGNQAWGYIMSSYGYSANYAHAGAGAQQVYNDARYGHFHFEGSVSTWGDDPVDWKAIARGYGQYHSEHAQ
jgi:hypothetical protein